MLEGKLKRIESRDVFGAGVLDVKQKEGFWPTWLRRRAELSLLIQADDRVFRLTNKALCTCEIACCGNSCRYRQRDLSDSTLTFAKDSQEFRQS